MENVTIISHLTPREWKMSWENKVVEDSRENMRAYQQQNCFWGHFKNDRDFTICHHKEFEIKGMSLGLYLMEQSKMMSVVVRLLVNSERRKQQICFLEWEQRSVSQQYLEQSHVRIWKYPLSRLYCLPFTDCLFCKATEGTETDSGQLEKISFDNNYHRKVSKKAKADVKKKRTMREKAMVNVE